jgi:CTP:molybdopterin cytidylyltransferase MocA
VSVAAIVLAAGASRRLGEPKQLVRLGKETLLERIVRICHDAGCTPVVVVLGAAADLLREQCALSDANIVVNEEWAQGMGTSIRAGARALGNMEGCLIVTCDMPAVSAEHLQKLMRVGDLAASAYAGRQGVPAYFPRATVGELLKLRGDQGARDLLKQARPVELAYGELDIDTAEDLERMHEIFG